MKRKLNKTFYILIMIICCFFFQTTAYSLLGSSFTITGDAIARIRNNVRINDFRIHEVSDGVISSYEEFSKTTTNSNVTLPNSDSYIIYRLDIGNYESVEMQLSNISGLSSNLTYELIDYTLHDMICDVTDKCTSGAEKTIYIKIMYANYDSANTNYNVNLNYQFSEFSNVLMVGDKFKDTIPSTATHLVFTDEKPVQGTVLTDVSLNADMGVVGYLDGTTYKVSTRRTGVMPEANSDSSYMFNGSALTSIDLDNLNTSSLNNMSYMFQDCTNLTSINFGDSFNTTKVSLMRSVFKNCTNLASLDLSSFVTNKVTSFSEMFMNCSSLISADVSGFNTSASTSFRQMFEGCNLLEIIDVSKFNTSKVTNMKGMFANCSSVKILDVSGFDTSQVNNLDSMFKNCSLVEVINVSNFNTSNVTTMASMFYNCSSVLVLDVSGFDTSQVTDMTSMFNLCKNVKVLDVAHFITSNVTSLQSMFTDCISLLSLDIKNWDVSKNVSLYGTFNRCNSLTELDLSGWDVSGLKICYWVFTECKNMTTLNLSGWKFKNDVSVSGMFFGMGNLTSINVDNWNTSSVNNMGSLFLNCWNLKSLDLTSWDTSSVTNMSRMFERCDALETLYVGNGWNTSSVTVSDNMFYSCIKLPNFDSTVLDVSKAYVGDGGYLSSNLSTVSIDGVNYTYKNGMTWEEWIDSDYNVDCFKIVSSASDYSLLVEADMYKVPEKTDLIISGKSYVFADDKLSPAADPIYIVRGSCT